MEAALHRHHAAAFHNSGASSSAKQAAPKKPVNLDSSPDAQGHLGRATASSADAQQQAVDAVSSSANALHVLKKLQSLPWRRIDVSFQHSKLPFFAHNNIQVTRKWLNWEGAVVCQHLAQQFAVMEQNDCIHLLTSNACQTEVNV